MQEIKTRESKYNTTESHNIQRRKQENNEQRGTKKKNQKTIKWH